MSMVPQLHTSQYEDLRASDHATLGFVLAADMRQLQAHERRLRQLAMQLADSGFISSGSVVQRSGRCGTTSCRCHADPPQLHGPYWQWSYRPAGGKTISRQLNERQALLYQEWIANRRRLLAVVAEMEDVSRRAGELLLSESQPQSPASTEPVRPPGSPRRVTTALATALTQLAELIEPAAAAAEEWLEARDNEDRDATVEAREQLLATLDESPDLAAITRQLARLLDSVGQRQTS
jgi:hypothetical protein